MQLAVVFFAEDCAKLRCTVLFLSPDLLAEFKGETERGAEKRMCKGRGSGAARIL